MPVFQKDPSSPAEPQAAAQFLVFTLRGEEYALPLTDIREIVAVPETTPVPNMPPAVRGVANLRGRVVTVIDLAAHLALPASEETQPLIIVAEKGNELFGLLAHEAREVLRIEPSEQQETPETLRSHPGAHALKGVIVHKGATERLILSLDLPHILGAFGAAHSS